MKLRIFILSSILAISLAACSSKKSVTKKPRRAKMEKVQGYAFDFVECDSLGRILDYAAEQDKLVFVDMYTTWCLPCKLMDEEVFTHDETAAFFNEHFISYKVDGEKKNGPDLRVIFEATGFPTLLFLDTRGRVLEKKVGSAFHAELLELARSAIAKKPVR